MFDIDNYCRSYYMRKEAGFRSAGAQLFGNWLGGTGRFISNHFGMGRIGNAVGTKLSGWGNSILSRGATRLNNEWEEAAKATTKNVNAGAEKPVKDQVIDVSSTPHPTDSPTTVDTRNEINATKNVDGKMGWGKKLGIGALGVGVPLAAGIGVGYHMGSQPEQPQYATPSQLVGY